MQDRKNRDSRDQVDQDIARNKQGKDHVQPIFDTWETKWTWAKKEN